MNLLQKLTMSLTFITAPFSLALNAEKEALDRAISANDLKQMESLFKENKSLASTPDFNSEGMSLDYPIHKAVYRAKTRDNLFSMFELILQYGGSVNSKTFFGHTPLLLVMSRPWSLHNTENISRKDREDIAWFLIENGADNTPNLAHVDPFYIASEECYLSVVQHFINQGVDVNKKAYSDYPIHTAVSSGCIPVAEALIQNQAQITLRNSNGLSPLAQLVSFGIYGSPFNEEILFRNMTKFLIEQTGDDFDFTEREYVWIKSTTTEEEFRRLEIFREEVKLNKPGKIEFFRLQPYRYF